MIFDRIPHASRGKFYAQLFCGFLDGVAQFLPSFYTLLYGSFKNLSGDHENLTQNEESHIPHAGRGKLCQWHFHVKPLHKPVDGSISQVRL